MPLLSIALTQFTKKMPIFVMGGGLVHFLEGDGSIKKVF